MRAEALSRHDEELGKYPMSQMQLLLNSMKFREVSHWLHCKRVLLMEQERQPVWHGRQVALLSLK